MNRNAALAVLLLLSAVSVNAGEKEHIVQIHGHQIKVKLTENYGQTSIIRAECIIPRSQRIVWGILTDYDKLDDIIPAISISRFIRKGNGWGVLYQEGRAGIWFLQRSFTVTFRVEEVPMSYIGFDSFEGDFDKFKGSWQIAQKREGTWVIHRVEIAPRFFAPRWALRMMAQKLMFDTIDNVIERCMALESPSQGCVSYKNAICMVSFAHGNSRLNESIAAANFSRQPDAERY